MFEHFMDSDKWKNRNFSANKIVSLVFCFLFPFFFHIYPHGIFVSNEIQKNTRQNMGPIENSSTCILISITENGKKKRDCF